MDDETIAKWRARKFFTCRPSIIIAITSKRADAPLSAGATGTLNDLRAQSGNGKKAFRAGVRSHGSDAVYTCSAENTRELAWFVKAA